MENWLYSLLNNRKILKILPRGFSAYIFNPINYFAYNKDHLTEISKYISTYQINYLKKYSFENDLYFILKDLEIFKSPSRVLVRNIDFESAKNKCKVMGILSAYWQEKGTCSDHISYYSLGEMSIKKDIEYSRFSLEKKRMLFDIFTTFYNVSKENISNPIKIINDSELLENRIERR